MIVELTPSINAYASYAGIAKDNDTFGVTQFDRQPKGGGKFPPITGNSKEFGIKGGLFDDKLNFSLAYFTMTQNGYPSFKPTGVGECKSWDSSGQCI
ncbi:TPA: TonB-dependent receptor, partial [Neisseria bacilliformis]